MSYRKYKTTTGEFVYLSKHYYTRNGDVAKINQITHCSTGLVIGGIVNGRQEWWTKDGYRRTDEKETYIDLISSAEDIEQGEKPGTHITGELVARGGVKPMATSEQRAITAEKHDYKAALAQMDAGRLDATTHWETIRHALLLADKVTDEPSEQALQVGKAVQRAGWGCDDIFKSMAEQLSKECV